MSLLPSSNSQKAGDNATQIQAGTYISVQGIDEKRVREIMGEQQALILQKSITEAARTAEERLDTFKDIFVSELAKHQELINQFANPSFLRDLLETQKAAVSSERVNDFDRLAELLISRMKSNDDTCKRLGINTAIKIASEVSDKTIVALSVMYIVYHLRYRVCNYNNVIDIYEKLFGNINVENLPPSQEWLEEAELSQLIRLQPLYQPMSACSIISDSYSGITKWGISRKSDNFKKATDILTANHMPCESLVAHELDDQFVRLPLASLDDLDTLTYRTLDQYGNTSSRSLSPSEREAMIAIWNLYDKDRKTEKLLGDLFKNKCLEKPLFSRVEKWLNSSPCAFTLTIAGKALAHANLKCLGMTMPEFT